MPVKKKKMKTKSCLLSVLIAVVDVSRREQSNSTIKTLKTFILSLKTTQK